MDKRIGYLKVITGPMFAGKTEDSSQEIEKYLHNGIETIFIDEIQFFPPETVSFLCSLTQQGHQIIVAGLDKNFRGEPFNETIKTLLALADYVEKLTAICQVCQKEASFTQRMFNGQPARYHDPLILVGGQETYEARCGTCYVIQKGNMPNNQPNSPPRSKNTLIIIAGGSGTGKTTVENLLAQDPNIVKLISTTTRPPREREKDGQDYYFISKETFQAELEKGRFLEHVIYDGNHYGVYGKVVDLILGTQNKHGVIIVDVDGFRQIKKYCQEKGHNTTSYWFKAESKEKMFEHMKKRGTSESEILRRLIIAEKEEKFAAEFDHILTVKENELAAARQITVYVFLYFSITFKNYKNMTEINMNIKKKKQEHSPLEKDKKNKSDILPKQPSDIGKKFKIPKAAGKRNRKRRIFGQKPRFDYQKSLAAEYEKNYTRLLEKSHTTENKRD
ncbi:11535_t:CDS:2 [Gigaspora rosea]|nr:11535_t:CDS:2 [Gigaspora rosea]